MRESVLDTAVIPFRFTTEKKKITTQTVNAERYVRHSRIALGVQSSRQNGTISHLLVS